MVASGGFFWELGCFRLGFLWEDGLLLGGMTGLGSGGRLRGGGRFSGSSELMRFGSIMLLLNFLNIRMDVVMCVLCVERKTAFGNRGEAVSKNK